MATVLITGGTGLVGKALAGRLLQKNYQVVIISRNISLINHQWLAGVTIAGWDIEKQWIDENALASADYIVHLAGAGIAEKRWTEKRKKEIVDSRTKSSMLLVKSLKEIPNKVKAVISASAIGWYGADRPVPAIKYFTEADNPDAGFLGETCRLWEQSIDPVKVSNKRLVKIRTGIVLSRDGGALKEFAKLLKYNIAAIMGKGKQMISWIHIDDLCSMYIDAIENEKIDGVYNGVAPCPVNNKTFMMELGGKLKGENFLYVHIPYFMLRIILGEMGTELIKSCTVCSDKIKKTGFQFIYPTLGSALTALL